MTRKNVLLPTLLGLLLVAGLPLAPGRTPPAPTPDLAATPESPLKALVAQRSNLALVYDRWRDRHLAAGGDRNVVVALSWTEGMSTEPSRARGRARFDLLEGRVEVQVTGLRRPADVWILDNEPGPGRSALPETGDRLVRLGRLVRQGGGFHLAARLGPELFRDTELDWVVVTPAGASPAERSLLYGTRPFFERVYTRSRLAAAGARRPAGPSLVTWSGELLALLSPRVAVANSTQVLISHGLISQAVGDGGDLFFRETFDGNGRTCGTCHPVVNNQTIDPDFIATLPADDPLFVAELPKNQGGVPGLEKPALLRQFGLILENVDGFDDLDNKFTMRGVPHSLSLATSILAPAGQTTPAEQTGWSADGAPGSGALSQFPVGAVRQHLTTSLQRKAGRDFRFPTQDELVDMEAFMLSVGRLDDPDLSQVVLSDPGAANGLTIFNNSDETAGPAGKCLNCHFNAGANTVFDGTNRNFNTGVEDRFHPARTVESFPLDGGFGTDPVDLDGDGEPDLFGDRTFNTAGLVEAADTGPFFHNNVVDASLEAAVAFYSETEFNDSPSGSAVGGIALLPQESDDVAAFLRVLNAAFNIDISVQRNEAAILLENSGSPGGCGTTAGGEISNRCSSGGGFNGNRATVDALLSLSNAEAADAVEVLSAQGLNPSAVQSLNQAIAKNGQAIEENASQTRKTLMQEALSALNAAKADLGTGLDFLMGEGNLMF